MNRKLVFKIIGIILVIEAACLLLPFTVALVAQGPDRSAFALTILLCAVPGIALSQLKVEHSRLHYRDGYICVALCWIFLSIFGALPYTLSGCCGYVDALFETVSGFTTTGASVLSAPASLPRGIQFWRALTQWMGGMGVLVLLLALLPNLGDGSVNLMKAESPGPVSSKLLPRTADTAKVLYAIYISLTVLEILSLKIAGLSLFDSVTTSFTTISTGGFSVRNESIAYYQSEAVNWIICFFLLFSAVNFSLLFLATAQRKLKEALRSEELRTYLAIVFCAIALVCGDLILTQGYSPYTALSQASFQTLSLLTTAGYSTADYTLWPHFSQALLILTMFCGGCAGSTAGGIKVSRIVLLFKNMRRELRRILHPREVRPITLEGERVEESTVSSVSLFFFSYITILLFSTILVSLDNVGFVEAFSASLTAISNVGPGLGRLGPTFNFGFLSGRSKLILSMAMLLGRLEIIPILVLFFPSVWRKR